MSDRRRLAAVLPGPAAMLGLLSLVLGLVAVVALASRGGRPGGGATEPRGPSTLFWDYLFTMSILVAVMGMVVSVWLLKQRLDPELRADRKGNHMLLFAFLASLVLGVVLASQVVGRGDENRAREAAERLRGSLEQRKPRERDDAFTPSFLWGPAIALGAVGVVAAAYLRAKGRVRRRDADEASDDALAEELAALLDDTLDDLRAEPDPRRAVIAAYARMERALSAYGLPRHPFEAPLEFLERASPELRERHPAGLRLVFELSHLFERAKFSHHAVDEEMKADAIASLEGLRDELRRGTA
jgi:Domain of unknown function (DUF4129)